MQIPILIFTVFASVIQQISRKEYGKRACGGTFTFSLCAVISTLIYFTVTAGGRIDFSPELIKYLLPFSVCYTVAYICTMLAIENGPLSLTSLMISYSLVIPTVYGIAVLREPVKIFSVAGIILLLISLIFIECSGKKAARPITLKWIIYVGATFLSNGICTTIQKVFQAEYRGEYSAGFMIISLAFTSLFILIAAIVRERAELLKYLKKCPLWSLTCGIGNGVQNQLTMALAITLPASFLYPVLSAGGIILTALASLLIYKEKLSVMQWAGLVMGIFAITFLNI